MKSHVLILRSVGASLNVCPFGVATLSVEAENFGVGLEVRVFLISLEFLARQLKPYACSRECFTTSLEDNSSVGVEDWASSVALAVFKTIAAESLMAFKVLC